MRNLFVFVEGKEDIIFVKNVLHNIFIKHSINVIPIPYQKTRNHEVINHIKASKARNQDYVIERNKSFKYFLERYGIF